MAKTKKKIVSKMPRRSGPRRPRNTVAEDSLDDAALQTMKMYQDPCGASLVPTVYPGDRGYVNRFTSSFNGGTGTGETASIVIFKPGVNVMYNGAGATGATAVTVNFADTQAPGAAFLNANATKCRCTGACLQVRPNAAPTDGTGQIYFGVIPASSVLEASTPNANELISLLSNTVTVSQALMEPLEVKWSPGAFDDRYCPTTGVTGDDDSDRNVIVIVSVGLKAASGLNFRATGIYEWAPSRTIATIDSTAISPSRCDFGCILRNLKRKDPEWWWQLGIKALRNTAGVVQGYYTGGPMGAVRKLAAFAS